MFSIFLFSLRKSNPRPCETSNLLITSIEHIFVSQSCENNDKSNLVIPDVLFLFVFCTSISFLFLEVVYVIDSSIVDPIFDIAPEEKVQRCEIWRPGAPSSGASTYNPGIPESGVKISLDPLTKKMFPFCDNIIVFRYMLPEICLF